MLKETVHAMHISPPMTIERMQAGGRGYHAIMRATFGTDPKSRFYNMSGTSTIRLREVPAHLLTSQ
jgi:hypothetical protein